MTLEGTLPLTPGTVASRHGVYTPQAQSATSACCVPSVTRRRSRTAPFLSLSQHAGVRPLERAEKCNRLTFPGLEEQRSPELGTALGATPALELERANVAADDQLVHAAEGEPGSVEVVGADEKVRGGVEPAEEGGEGDLVIVEGAAGESVGSRLRRRVVAL